MQINYNVYSLKYCSAAVPKELLVLDVPKELKICAVDEYARLKDGIEITYDNLYEFVNNTQEFADINTGWQEFLKEVLKIEADTYILHN